MTKKQPWPFDQPPDCACITLKSIVDKKVPILLITHDFEDDGWQFLSLEDVKPEDALVVSMQFIVQLDASVLDLAHILPGWRAWRKSTKSKWRIEKKPSTL